MKPILFNTQMVQAIVEGRKTVTRRCVKPRFEGRYYPIWDYPERLIFEKPTDPYDWWQIWIDHKGSPYTCTKPPYFVGDILYVRETWRCWRAHRYEATADIEYKAGGDGIRLYFSNGSTDNANRDDYDTFIKKYWRGGDVWKPSIHMPKEAARIFLRVTNVSVARLQDITENDAYREGVMKAHDPTFNTDYWYYKEGQNYSNGKCWAENARQCFLWGIWNGTLKKPKEYERYNQNRNPWVWVIEFERTEKPNE